MIKCLELKDIESLVSFSCCFWGYGKHSQTRIFAGRWTTGGVPQFGSFSMALPDRWLGRISGLQFLGCRLDDLSYIYVRGVYTEYIQSLYLKQFWILSQITAIQLLQCCCTSLLGHPKCNTFQNKCKFAVSCFVSAQRKLWEDEEVEEILTRPRETKPWHVPDEKIKVRSTQWLEGLTARSRKDKWKDQACEKNKIMRFQSDHPIQSFRDLRSERTWTVNVWSWRTIMNIFPSPAVEPTVTKAGNGGGGRAEGGHFSKLVATCQMPTSTQHGPRRWRWSRSRAFRMGGVSLWARFFSTLVNFCMFADFAGCLLAVCSGHWHHLVGF